MTAATPGAGRSPPPWVVAVASIGVGGWSWLLATHERAGPAGQVYLAVFVAGVSFAVGGLIVWQQWPRRWLGPLLLVTAASLALPTLATTRVPLLWTLGSAGNSAFAPLLVYLVLSFPHARPLSRLDRALVAWTALIAIVPTIVLQALIDPARMDCPDCPRDLNLIGVAHEPEFVFAAAQWVHWVIALSAIAVAGRLAQRLWAGTGPARRILGPVLLPGALWFAIHGITRGLRNVLRDVLPNDEVLQYGPITIVSTALLTVVPFGVLVGLLRARARRARVGDLVLELGELPAGERLGEAVARTLGDPDAQVGFWVAETGRYITVEGEPLELPGPDSGRDVTYVEGRGRSLAAIVHDVALREEPLLVNAVRAAARLAVENERLHADALARLEEVRASRARMVEAGDAERRRIERNLHDGAQQRLIAVILQLRMLADALDDDAVKEQIEAVVQEVTVALAELRDLAQGLHPSILADEGLGAAVEYLAESAPLPVSADVADERFPEAIEVTAYFLVSEALANAAKHANATEVWVSVKRVDGRVAVEVRDDGSGGAGMARGSGLRGLGDRVAAVGGQLRIESPAGRGTHVVAELPCD